MRSYENASVFVRPSINNEPADLATRNQWWRIEFHHSEKEDNDETVNYYTIKNILFGFVLTADGVDLYTKIVQRKFVDGNDEQRWNIKYVNSIYYSLQNKKSKLFINHDRWDPNKEAFLDIWGDTT